MSTFDLENPDPIQGDELRDEAANLLTVRYGRVKREHRVQGKKVDIYFEERVFGKTRRHYIEAKDYQRRLHRNDVVLIWSDYDDIVGKNAPADLILVTRQGLSADAQSYIDEKSTMMHQTIWELESETLGLTNYIRYLSGLFREDGLDQYYIECRAKSAQYSTEDYERSHLAASVLLLDQVRTWIDDDSNYQPIAILGGYGAGKTSLAKRIVADQASLSLRDPLKRIPVMIRLGNVSRFSSLDGILGGMFTHEHVAPGFDFRFFKSLNEKGRMLIVLDGFDEMKHAMTWSDFRSQITDLNELVRGKAKVVLLGRPTAFIDHDEHIHVLKGVRPFGVSYRRLPDWPDFLEYDIDPFTEDDRRRFMRLYLAYRSRFDPRMISVTVEWIENRLVEVEALAGADEDVFAKPVHARILIDLACDPTVDLSQFNGRITQWVLYEEFFKSLIERELEKHTRKAVGANLRLQFMRSLAFWLWSERAAATSFNAEDVPSHVFTQSGMSYAEHDDDGIRRELLNGAFLEKKGGDIFFFAHRSFAEFLVADYMIANPPTGVGHSIYSRMADDGVRGFLLQANKKKEIRAWGDTLSSVQGSIHLSHIEFIMTFYSDMREFLDRTNMPVPLQNMCQNVFRDKAVKPGSALNKSLLTMMRQGTEDTFHLALGLYSSYSSDRLAGHQLNADMRVIAAAVLDRIFESASQDVTSRKWSVAHNLSDSRSMLTVMIPDITSDHNGRYLRFSITELANRNRKVLSKLGYELRGTLNRGFLDVDAEVSLPLRSVQELMTISNAEKLAIFVQDFNSFRSIFAKDQPFNGRRR